jgi:hypothetical protein
VRLLQVRVGQALHAVQESLRTVEMSFRMVVLCRVAMPQYFSLWKIVFYIAK